MEHKLQLLLSVVVVTLCVQYSSAIGVCTLDDMRSYAAEACEHVFQDDDPRGKREVIFNGLGLDLFKYDISEDHTTNQIHGSRHHHLRHEKKVKIRRNDYPKGGYLLLDHTYAKKLKRFPHEPKYEDHHHIVSSGESSETNVILRTKRHNKDRYIYIPYCCVNKCEVEDYLCLR